MVKLLMWKSIQFLILTDIPVYSLTKFWPFPRRKRPDISISAAEKLATGELTEYVKCARKANCENMSGCYNVASKFKLEFLSYSSGDINLVLHWRMPVVRDRLVRATGAARNLTIITLVEWPTTVILRRITSTLSNTREKAHGLVWYPALL
jgi:hypothetical protein